MTEPKIDLEQTIAGFENTISIFTTMKKNIRRTLKEKKLEKDELKFATETLKECEETLEMMIKDRDEMKLKSKTKVEHVEEE